MSPPDRRPPWWPTDEPWPPRGRGPGRGRGWQYRGGGRPPGRRPLGFGCFFLAVLLVAGSVVVTLVSVAFHVFGLVTGTGGAPGPLTVAAFVVLIVGAVVAFALARVVRWTAGTLDELLEATQQIEAGRYDVRVQQPRGPRPVRELVAGFNTMAARLETDEAQRRELLADVSHELRTPLSVVQGNLEAILDGVHPADEAHLEPILEETRVIGRLIEDLRTLALSDAGTLALHREPTDLSVLAEDVAATFRPQTGAAGIKLNVDVADDLPLVDADPVRIREVLSNLVSNALRYTPAGGSIAIRARVDEASRSIDVRVADTGRGIAADELPHVFERFRKSAESRGSGLGLAIARSLVAAHGGSIRAASQPGDGTTIAFSLPIAEGE